jgi:hypothetical protein
MAQTYALFHSFTLQAVIAVTAPYDFARPLRARAGAVLLDFARRDGCSTVLRGQYGGLPVPKRSQRRWKDAADMEHSRANRLVQNPACRIDSLSARRSHKRPRSARTIQDYPCAYAIRPRYIRSILLLVYSNHGIQKHRRTVKSSLSSLTE